ncbi:MAG: hypothetical protein WC332_02195 [Clostridia bacterium]|jgi:hypothetical protein
MNKIKFVANAVRWFDKVNGNTYHSVNITRVKDGKKIYCPMAYGYGEHYRQTALESMLKNSFIPLAYVKRSEYKNIVHLYERENNYPIMWNVTDGLKRDCIKNGKP